MINGLTSSEIGWISGQVRLGVLVYNVFFILSPVLELQPLLILTRVDSLTPFEKYVRVYEFSIDT